MRQFFKMHFTITVLTIMSYVSSLYIPTNEHKEENTGKFPMENKLVANITMTTILNETRSDLKYLQTRSAIKEACNLQVVNESKNQFTHAILKNHYNFVHFKLNFLNFSVNETNTVISKNDWIWTYKGESGAHQYLYLPTDYGYLSFGLLWAHTLRESMHIYIRKTGECKNLTIGRKETDYLIGQALGNMTSEIASHNDMYNSSYWCYSKRSWIQSMFIYVACKNSICTFQTVEYKCCKFHTNYTEKTRNVTCEQEHFYYGALWWMLPIITGNICFAFYPLLLTKIGIIVKSKSKKYGKETCKSINMDGYFETTDVSSTGEEKKNKQLYVSVKCSNPITVSSTLCSPLNDCDLSGPIVSRALRICIIILPITISAIRVVADFIYAKDILIEAVKKGALFGFSSILAGPNEARKQFLLIFGGPVVALLICISFGCLLIVFPSNLAYFLRTGLPTRIRKFVFLVRMPLQLKEKLSGINVRHYKGYKELHKLLLAQIFMLLHIQFWRQSTKLFYLRWKNIIFTAMTLKLRSTFAAVVSSIFILPLYIMFCLSELFFAVLYYAFPVINCFFIVLKSFLIHYFKFFKHGGCAFKMIQYVLFLPTLISFCIFWYMYCIIFFDGFWFLSKIVMFTYSGLIAYPKLSYGYLVLVLMAIYYLMESFHAFGESYRELLKLSLEACEKFQQKHLDDSDMDQDEVKSIRTKFGIKRDLFYMIVDRHLPKRNQVLITILKFTCVITVLTISVELLATFDKFQELSVITHVFTVLVVCALPKIIKTMCLRSHRYRTLRKMQQKMLKTIADYVKNRTRTVTASEDNEGFLLYSQSSGYESFRDMDSEENN